MKKSLLLLFACCGILLMGCSTPQTWLDEALDYCVAQSERALDELQPLDFQASPRNIAPNEHHWSMRPVSKELWTEGFWPGILWYCYEQSQHEPLREAAEGYTEALGFLSEIPAYDHDLGFIIFCSYGNGYRLTERADYQAKIVAIAERITELYNPEVGTLLSWPREVATFGGHNTIMDNMINLETLFWASEVSGNKRYAEIARSHADTTMKYHFREDGSSYHVAVYNAETGAFLRGCTHQGYADSSMWARGQAWAIYGYTMCYRFTKEERYRDMACKAADCYLNRLPEDRIPYWDFDDPRIPNAPRDASAAAVVASALIELATYVEGEQGATYLNEAEQMLSELNSNYRAGEQSPAFLLHSTGHHPAGSEIDYSIVYADYYYIEALLRLKAHYLSLNR